MTRPLTARLALLGLLAAAQPATAHEVGAWAGASSAPAERSEVAVAALDGKAYVIGDYNGATELLIYDLAADRWSKGAPFPYPVHHTMAAEAGGRIYVFGGYVNGWEATDRVWAYDPGRNAWEPRAKMPTPRAAGGATPLGDRIHVVGGSGSGRGNVASHEVYDPTRDAWTRAADLPTPRDHLAVQTVAGRIVASGGNLPVARIDQDLRRCGVERGCQQAVGEGGRDEDQHGPEDAGPPPPEDAPEVADLGGAVEAGRRVVHGRRQGQAPVARVDPALQLHHGRVVASGPSPLGHASFREGLRPRAAIRVRSRPVRFWKKPVNTARLRPVAGRRLTADS